VLTGKDVSAEVSSPQGRNKIININIPPGIESGQQIRYEGMGDTSNTNLPPGDLIVNVIVSPNLSFRRSGTILIIEKDISVWDAILGTSINIITLDNKTLNINIPAGTQPDTVFSCKGEGLPDMRTRQRGNLMLKLKVKVPTTILPEHAELIKHIKNEL
jgi:DnaJ-class molecular chaperone